MIMSRCWLDITGRLSPEKTHIFTSQQTQAFQAWDITMSELLLILSGVHKSKCNQRLTRLSQVKLAPKPGKLTGHDHNLITSKGSQIHRHHTHLRSFTRWFVKRILQKNRVIAYTVTIYKLRHALILMFSNWPNFLEILVSTWQPYCSIKIDVLRYFPCHCYSIFLWRLIFN